MIKEIIFDFGGVLIEIDTQRAIGRFKELGLTNAEEYLNSYKQSGTFFSLENGDITADTFVDDLSQLCNRKISHEEAEWAWMGFVIKVQTEFLESIQQLRPQYRLSILSNTNPFLQGWARSSRFTPAGKSLDDYFDSLYLSYKMNCSKPNDDIYMKMLAIGNMKPDEVLFIDDGAKNIEAAQRAGINVLKVENGEDWRPKLLAYLDSHNR